MIRNSRFIFLGTPEFAARILEHLIESGFVPACVICNPDRPVGRKKIITPPPTKVFAEKYGIQVLQPETSANYKLQITNYKANFFVVAAYAKIIPEKILNIPKRGAIGVHPSLLPKYRGASPIQTALLNGETETGITLFLMDEQIDHGPILAQERTPIGITETYAELHDRLAEIGGALLVKTLPKFLTGEIVPVPQNHAEATMTKKFKTEDGYVDSLLLEKAQSEGGKTAQTVFNKIRGLGAEPGVWTIQHKRRVKLIGATLTPEGKLKLLKVQTEGKLPMPLN